MTEAKLPEPGKEKPPNMGAAYTPPAAREKEDQAKTRREIVAVQPFGHGSLCKSWFLMLDQGEPCWQGQVLAEPQAGYYLVDIEQLLEGEESACQKLIFMERMLDRDGGEDWRFFDSEEKMRDAWALIGMRKRKEAMG